MFHEFDRLHTVHLRSLEIIRTRARWFVYLVIPSEEPYGHKSQDTQFFQTSVRPPRRGKEGEIGGFESREFSRVTEQTGLRC